MIPESRKSRFYLRMIIMIRMVRTEQFADVETYNYKLNDGNPNVNDVKSNLNGLLINKVLVSYDKQRNKFTFKRSLPVSTQNYTMYLNIINSEDFLGFYKVIEI